MEIFHYFPTSLYIIVPERLTVSFNFLFWKLPFPILETIVSHLETVVPL